MQPPAAVRRENGNTLAGAGGPIETDRVVYVLRPRRVPLPQKRKKIKSFFPEIAFSGKIPLAERTCERSECDERSVSPHFSEPSEAGLKSFVRQTPICGMRNPYETTVSRAHCRTESSAPGTSLSRMDRPSATWAPGSSSSMAETVREKPLPPWVTETYRVLPVKS